MGEIIDSIEFWFLVKIFIACIIRRRLIILKCISIFFSFVCSVSVMIMTALKEKENSMFICPENGCRTEKEREHFSACGKEATSFLSMNQITIK